MVKINENLKFIIILIISILIISTGFYFLDLSNNSINFNGDDFKLPSEVSPNTAHISNSSNIEVDYSTNKYDAKLYIFNNKYDFNKSLDRLFSNFTNVINPKVPLNVYAGDNCDYLICGKLNNSYFILLSSSSNLKDAFQGINDFYNLNRNIENIEL